jgi:20S proteasome alpha/beta subunit
MTIAIGMLCDVGVIVAADTNVIFSDFSKSQVRKVSTFHTETGCYVIANAADDGNAARTLVSKVTSELQQNPIPSLAYLESLLANVMTNWASAFSQAPLVRLLVGARINEDAARAVLYLCEPPNTVLRKEEREWGGYIAIGAGATITDPIYRTWLSSTTATARLRLIQISYLMYRAKKDNALCGGPTMTAIVKHQSGSGPISVMSHSMSSAEDVCNRLDFLLRRTADAVMRESDETVESFVQHHAAAIVNMGRAFRELKFETSGGPL